VKEQDMAKIVITVSEAGVTQVRVPVASLADEQQAMKLLAHVSVAVDLLSRAAQDFPIAPEPVPPPEVETGFVS
jgi:NifB/MoaA-like Fe-S oxidoreductase